MPDDVRERSSRDQSLIDLSRAWLIGFRDPVVLWDTLGMSDKAHFTSGFALEVGVVTLAGRAGAIVLDVKRVNGIL
jgi:hypothetical protein